MAIRISDSPTFENLDKSLEAIQAGPPAFVVLEVDGDLERRVAVSLVRRLPRSQAVDEFTFGRDTLDIRKFLGRKAPGEGEVVFLFGLAGLSPVDRQHAWATLNMAREIIRASRRSFVLFVDPTIADEFPLRAPDLHACVPADFRVRASSGDRRTKDPLSEKPVAEIQRLLGKVSYYESLIDQDQVPFPETRASLIRRYAEFLEGIGEAARADDLRKKADGMAGKAADESPWVLQDYLEGVLKETSVVRVSDLAVQVGQQILEIALEDIYVPLRLLRTPARRPLEPAQEGYPGAPSDTSLETGENPQGRSRVPVQLLALIFCDKLAEARFTSADAVRDEGDHLLTTLSQHSGLFPERGSAADGEPLYGFLHLTFQEYLAALHLFQRWGAWVATRSGGRSPSRKAGGNPVHPYLFELRRQEIILLAASRASETNSALASTFAKGVPSYRDKYESILRRALLCGVRTLSEDIRVDRATAQGVGRAFAGLLTKSDIPSQRAAAVGILSRLRGTVCAGLAGAELLKRLNDPDRRIRVAAADALGVIKYPRALEALVERLGDPDLRVRSAAAWGLVFLEDPRAAEIGLRRRGDLDPDVELAVAETLALRDPRALESCFSRLDDADSSIRQAAAEALPQLKDPRAVESLLRLLGDTEWIVRWVAAEALSELKDPRGVEPLLECLKAPDSWLRNAAALALGKINDPGAVEPLLKRLEDTEPHVRAAAARALGKLREARCLDPLLARLEDPHADVREAVAQALGELEDPRAVQPLLRRLRDEWWAVRAAAAEALGQLRDPRALKPLAAIALRRTRTKTQRGVRKPVRRRKPHLGVAEARDALFRLLYPGVIESSYKSVEPSAFGFGT